MSAPVFESERSGTASKSALRAGVAEYQLHMGGCQKYGPFLGPYYNTAPNI